MDRRVIGLLVIMLGLLAAVVVPNAIGRSIPGVAQAVPVPGPPSAGDCVGQEFDPAWGSIGVDPSGYRYPELVVGDCGQAHDGEVVSVIARPTKPNVVVSPGGGSSVHDNNMEACSETTGRFLGLADSAGESALHFDYWSYTLSWFAVPLTPTGRQQAADQQWLACTVYLVEQPDADGGSLIRYQGSLRDAVSTGAGRDHLGRCPTEAAFNSATSFTCTKPHRGEIFAYGAPSQDVARATLTSRCTKLVEQVMQNLDLVRGGRSVVDVQVTDTDGNAVSGSTTPKGSTMQCGVVTTGGQMLRGSLRAIGTEPIPWA